MKAEQQRELAFIILCGALVIFSLAAAALGFDERLKTMVLAASLTSVVCIRLYFGKKIRKGG